MVKSLILESKKSVKILNEILFPPIRYAFATNFFVFKKIKAAPSKKIPRNCLNSTKEIIQGKPYNSLFLKHQRLSDNLRRLCLTQL